MRLVRLNILHQHNTFIQFVSYVSTEARIKKIAPRVPNGKVKTKFKIRCSRYLYTLSLDDPEKAEKLAELNKLHRMQLARESIAWPTPVCY